MEIVFDKKDDVNALVRVKIEKADYQPKVEKTLKDFAKKANIKGFRVGKVPMPVVQKMFGKDVKVQEVNEVAKDSLFNYLKEQEIDILASPLVSLETAENFSWTSDKFEFIYELGLKPTLAIDLAQAEVPFYTIEVGDTEIQALKDRLLEIYADFTKYEEVGEGHTVFGLLKYGDNLSRFVHLKLDEVTKETAALLKGKKVAEAVTLTIKNIFADNEKLSKAFRLSPEETAKVEGDGELTIREVFVAVPPAINAEFFDKVFGEGQVTTEEGFKEKLEAVLQKKYAIEATGIAVTYFREHLLKTVDVTLPDEFLKKWLQSTAKSPINDIDAAYTELREGIRYDLILSQLAKENGVKAISQEDMLAKVRDTYFLEFFYSRPMFVEGLTDYFAYQFLQSEGNEAMIENLRGAILAERILEATKANINAKNLTASGTEFEEKELKKVQESVNE